MAISYLEPLLLQPRRLPPGSLAWNLQAILLSGSLHPENISSRGEFASSNLMFPSICWISIRPGNLSPFESPQYEAPCCLLAMRYTWNSEWLWNSSMSTTGSLLTYRCLSNSCRTFVRSWETGKLSEYICWISGAWCARQNQFLGSRAAAISRDWLISAIVGRHGSPSAAHLANLPLRIVSLWFFSNCRGKKWCRTRTCFLSKIGGVNHHCVAGFGGSIREFTWEWSSKSRPKKILLNNSFKLRMYLINFSSLKNTRLSR